MVSPGGVEESDRDLLLAGRSATLAMNRANASRWGALVSFFRRKVATQNVRESDNPHAPLTARQETVIEVGELWGLSPGHLRRELNAAIFLEERMPLVWGLAQRGSLDHYRARLIADALRREVDDDTSLEAVDGRISKFLLKHLRSLGADEGLICCTIRQVQNKLAYEVRRLRSADAESRFARKYADRNTTVQAGEDGIGWLTIESAVDRVALAHHRLTLAAKERRAEGDARTLDQLRSDLALDLLTGVTSSGEPATVPVPGFARPIINVTVPIQTLMGIADHPGELSGGTVIPASLARVIAHRPGATWYRMLTDGEGQMRELSTKSYQPTAPIWRDVVAAHTTCFRPGCDRPATECELDHRMRWPLGPTNPQNLWPACKADHKAKHTPGFAIDMTESGRFALVTPAGFAHPVDSATHPVTDEWPDVPTEGLQFSVAEFCDAVEVVRERAKRAPDYIGLWEDGERAFWQFADLEVISAVYDLAA